MTGSGGDARDPHRKTGAVGVDQAHAAGEDRHRGRTDRSPVHEPGRGAVYQHRSVWPHRRVHQIVVADQRGDTRVGGP